MSADVIHRILDIAVLVQSGLIVATIVTVLVMYRRHDKHLKRHVQGMMISHLLLTLVIAVNVTIDAVQMPWYTAVMALTGFVLSDVALWRYLTHLKLHVA